MTFKARYLLAVLTPIAPWLHWAGNNYAYTWITALLTVLTIHALIPLLDWVIGEAGSTVDEAATHWANRLIPLVCVPAWFAALGFAAWQGSSAQWPDWLATGIAIGTIGGITAINIAHELIHRSTRVEREAGGLLLASVCYSAFRIEHVLGHHLRVATPLDTATAKRGESVYGFIPRSVLGTLTNAWRIEGARLKRAELGSWHNHYLHGVGLTLAIALLLAAAFGVQAIGMLLLISMVAIIELELVNYIEHYGLQRRQGADGRYEPFGPQHAWNANTAVVNSFLVNLQRHADHHLHAGRDYMHLRSLPESPQLPAGYGAMVLLALVPPWWRKVMDRRLDPPSA